MLTDMRDDLIPVLPIEFFVQGRPRPQGSKRPLRSKTGKLMMVEQVSGLEDWRQNVRYEAMRQWEGGELFEGPVAIEMLFTLHRPKSVSEKKRPLPLTYPDIDKLARGVNDSLTGIILRGDAQVVTLMASKRYAPLEGVIIRIREETL